MPLFGGRTWLRKGQREERQRLEVGRRWDRSWRIVSFLPRTFKTTTLNSIIFNKGVWVLKNTQGSLRNSWSNVTSKKVKIKLFVKYLSGLDPRYAHVVKLQQYSSFDDVCVLAHRVKQQKKSKPFKKDLPKPPLPKSSPFNKGSFQPPSKPTTLFSTPPQRTQLHKTNPYLALTPIGGVTSAKA